VGAKLSETVRIYNANESQPVTSFLSYQNSIYGISIKYPDNWSVQEYNSTKNMIIHIIDIYPPLAYDSKAITCLQISTRDLQDKKPDIDLLARNAIEAWRKISKRFRLISATATQRHLLTGRQTYTIVFKNSDMGHVLKRMQIGTIYDNKVYYILFTTEAAKYDWFNYTVQNVIESLQLIPMELEQINNK
jgi:hypothetical protein